MTTKWNPYEELLDNTYWIAHPNNATFECIQCGEISLYPYKICPNCKSKMGYIVEADMLGCVQNKLA